MSPRCTQETDGIAGKLVQCGIVSEALRRNWPLSQDRHTTVVSAHKLFPTSASCHQLQHWLNGVGRGGVKQF